MSTIDLNVSPLGRVEGDLDVRVTIDDGVVTSAWTTAGMFRGFEMILKGKDPQAGLIVTPRICGICGGSHLYKSAYALDTAWQTELPPNATLIRNIAQACETLQSIPRYFYALFAIDLTNKKYARSPLYEEAVRRFAPYVGTAYQKGVVLSGKPVEVYAMFGGQWPHSSFMVPGGVMCAPTLAEVTRSIAILENWKGAWLEGEWLGCSIDRWLENKTWDDILAWVDENESQHNSDCGFFIRYCMDVGLDTYGAGCGNYIATGTYFDPDLYRNPTIEGRNAALINRSGIYAHGQFSEFDHLRVAEDTAHSFYQGSGLLHPWDGVTNPIDPADGAKQGKYSLGQEPPRYNVEGHGHIPLETGPLARRMAAAAPGAGAPSGRRPPVPGHHEPDRPVGDGAPAGPGPRGAEVLQVGPPVARRPRPAGELLRQAGGARVGQGLRVHRSGPRLPVGLDRARRGQDRELPGRHPHRLEHRPPRRSGHARPHRAGPGRRRRSRTRRTRWSWATSPAASTPAWCAPCTPTTARPARSCPAS